MIWNLSAILSGLLLTAAFPRPGISGLAWFALVPLLIALGRGNFKAGARLGFITGLVHYFTLLYWIIPFFQTFAHFPIYLAIPVHFLFAAILALFSAAFGAAVSGCCARPALCLVAVPIFWTALEYMRAFSLSGFPWELLGYSQYTHLPILQIADVTGVYGVSFIIAAVNAALTVSILWVFRIPWLGRSCPRLAGTLAVPVVALAVAGLWLYGNARLAAIDQHIATASPRTIAVVQGNVAQDIKWEVAFQEATTEKYIRMSLAAADKQPDLVVWPETATPFYFPYHTILSGKVLAGVVRAGTYFLIGSPSVEGRADDRIATFNSAFMIDPGGEIQGRYDKVHLVPFGEYVPAWLPFVDKIVAEVGDFSLGSAGRTLPWGRESIGPLICYEVIFPELSRAMTRNGATILVNITNDAWYGRSGAPYQHFSHAVLRAVENRRALIRAANTGISGFIDPSGRIMARTALFEDALVIGRLPLMTVDTIYTRYGDLFARGCLALAVSAWMTGALRALLYIRRQKRMLVKNQHQGD